VLNWPRAEVIPYRENSACYLKAFSGLPWLIWLDSGRPACSDGRYDLIAADPYQRLLAVEGRISLLDESGNHLDVDVDVDADPLQLLRDCLGEIADTPGDLPFAGGAMGYLGYDLARNWMPLVQRQATLGVPELALGIYDWAVVVDHHKERAWLTGQGRDPRTAACWASLVDALSTVEKHRDHVAVAPPELLHNSLSRSEYATAFARIQHYIREGDCYQVNYAQHMQAGFDGDPLDLYQQIRRSNPAPYGVYMDFGSGQLLGSSPEQFLQLDGGRVQTRPIKGTRPRGHTVGQDRLLRSELMNSAKDRAENLMIVDLLRNDLGRVCVPGSIRVPELFKTESFATVHHLVSTVTGELAKGTDAIDLLRACFPGGSITGAPKLRAMQVIDELEPVRRDIYCGSVLRLGFDGCMDSNITIRTLLNTGGGLHYWAGGGIVADSDCAAEYQESLDKSAAFLALLK